MTKTKDNAIIVHRFLYNIASLAIKVFLPIIIYQQTSEIRLALLFAGFQHIFGGLFTVLLKNFLVKKQLYSILISIVPLILIQVLINFIDINITSIIILSALAGIANPLYFIPLNIYFAKKDKKNNVAKFEVGSVLGKIFFVILNGYILGSALENSLLIVFSFSIVVFLISLIPLITNFKEINDELKNTQLKSLYKTNKKLTKANIFHLAFGFISQALYSVLPLYLYFSELSVESVAYVVAITEILKMGTFYLANLLNKKNLNIINYLVGCAITLVSSIVVIFSTSSTALFITGVVIGITFPFIFVPAFGNYCKNIKDQNITSEGLILRDFYILFPRGVVFSIFFIYPTFPVIFAVGAISSVAMFIARINRHN